MSRVGPVEKQLFLEDLGEKLLLTKARELGDAQAHAGIGADPASFGTVQGKVAGMDGLGAGIEAAAKGELAQRGQAVEAGRDQVMNRSAENNAAVQHHQDINRVEAQIGREATDEASEDLGSDANLATPVEWAHKEWLDDQARKRPAGSPTRSIHRRRPLPRRFRRRRPIRNSR